MGPGHDHESCISQGGRVDCAVVPAGVHLSNAIDAGRHSMELGLTRSAPTSEQQLPKDTAIMQPGSSPVKGHVLSTSPPDVAASAPAASVANALPPAAPGVIADGAVVTISAPQDAPLLSPAAAEAAAGNPDSPTASAYAAVAAQDDTATAAEPEPCAANTDTHHQRAPASQAGAAEVVAAGTGPASESLWSATAGSPAAPTASRQAPAVRAAATAPAADEEASCSSSSSSSAAGLSTTAMPSPSKAEAASVAAPDATAAAGPQLDAGPAQADTSSTADRTDQHPAAEQCHADATDTSAPPDLLLDEQLDLITAVAAAPSPPGSCGTAAGAQLKGAPVQLDTMNPSTTQADPVTSSTTAGPAAPQADANAAAGPPTPDSDAAGGSAPHPQGAWQPALPPPAPPHATQMTGRQVGLEEAVEEAVGSAESAQPGGSRSLTSPVLRTPSPSIPCSAFANRASALQVPVSGTTVSPDQHSSAAADTLVLEPAAQHVRVKKALEIKPPPGQQPAPAAAAAAAATGVDADMPGSLGSTLKKAVPTPAPAAAADMASAHSDGSSSAPVVSSGQSVSLQGVPQPPPPPDSATPLTGLQQADKCPSDYEAQGAGVVGSQPGALPLATPAAALPSTSAGWPLPPPPYYGTWGASGISSAAGCGVSSGGNIGHGGAIRMAPAKKVLEIKVPAWKQKGTGVFLPPSAASATAGSTSSITAAADAASQSASAAQKSPAINSSSSSAALGASQTEADALQHAAQQPQGVPAVRQPLAAAVAAVPFVPAAAKAATAAGAPVAAQHTAAAAPAPAPAQGAGPAADAAAVTALPRVIKRPLLIKRPEGKAKDSTATIPAATPAAQLSSRGSPQQRQDTTTPASQQQQQAAATAAKSSAAGAGPPAGCFAAATATTAATGSGAGSEHPSVEVLSAPSRPADGSTGVAQPAPEGAAAARQQPSGTDPPAVAVTAPAAANGTPAAGGTMHQQQEAAATGSADAGLQLPRAKAPGSSTAAGAPVAAEHTAAAAPAPAAPQGAGPAADAAAVTAMPRVVKRPLLIKRPEGKARDSIAPTPAATPAAQPTSSASPQQQQGATTPASQQQQQSAATAAKSSAAGAGHPAGLPAAATATTAATGSGAGSEGPSIEVLPAPPQPADGSTALAQPAPDGAAAARQQPSGADAPTAAVTAAAATSGTPAAGGTMQQQQQQQEAAATESAGAGVQLPQALQQSQQSEDVLEHVSPTVAGDSWGLESPGQQAAPQQAQQAAPQQAQQAAPQQAQQQLAGTADSWGTPVQLKPAAGSWGAPVLGHHPDSWGEDTEQQQQQQQHGSLGGDPDTWGAPAAGAADLAQHQPLLQQLDGWGEPEQPQESRPRPLGSAAVEPQQSAGPATTAVGAVQSVGMAAAPGAAGAALAPLQQLQQQQRAAEGSVRQLSRQQLTGAPDRPGGAAAAGNEVALLQPQLVQEGGRCYAFNGPLVCGECGIRGHTAGDCEVAYCEECDRFGHVTGRCDCACQECGKYHPDMPDSSCPVPRCPTCQLWGHTPQQCPDQQCSTCGCYGHLPQHCRACKACHQYGHSTQHCPNQQQPRQQQAGWLAGPQLPPEPPKVTRFKARKPADAPLPRKAAAWQHKRLQELQQLDALAAESPAASESSSVWLEAPEPEVPAVWEEVGGDWEKTGRTPVTASPVAGGVVANAEDTLQPLPQGLMPQQQAAVQELQYALQDAFGDGWGDRVLGEHAAAASHARPLGQPRGYEHPAEHAAAAAAAAGDLEVPPGFEGRVPVGRKYHRARQTAAAQHALSVLSSAPQSQPPGATAVQGDGWGSPGAVADPAAPFGTAARTRGAQHEAAAQPGSSTAVAVRGASGRRYVPVSGPVCRACGAEGHVDAECMAPYCQECGTVGHPDGRCAEACTTCGWLHGPPCGLDCQQQLCDECKLWGHNARHCPNIQCSRCQCWGHVGEECPGYCRKCHTAGHTTDACAKKRCNICHTPGHDTGKCPKQQALSRSASGQLPLPWDVPEALQQTQDRPATDPFGHEQPLTAADDGWGTQDSPWNQQAGGQETADVWAAPAHATSSVASVSAGHGDLADAWPHGASESQAEMLAWSPASSLEPQQHPAPRRTSSDDVAASKPQQVRGEAGELLRLPLLLPEHAAELQAALPEGMLPANWTSFATWHKLELSMHWVVKGMTRTQIRKLYQQVKQQAQQQSAAALQAGSAPAAAAPAHEATSAATVVGPAPGSREWLSHLQDLLGSRDVKWRAILPGGDRVGPFTGRELLLLLVQGGAAPKGVSSSDARQVAADPSGLLLCGILAKDYSAQKLPGAKFFKPLSGLVAATAAGLTYTPVTKADLAKGYPAPGWNDAPSASATGVEASARKMLGTSAASGTASAAPARRAGAGKAATAALHPPPAVATTLPQQKRSAATAVTAAASAPAPNSEAWAVALQKLLAALSVKWRAILPSGDRVGPFTAAELMAWLGGKGTAPKGVSREDAKSVLQQPSTLQLCGILTSDYNPQKLPGAKFYKALPGLVAAAASGLPYKPVTKADLAKGYPAPGWNEVSAAPTAAAAATETLAAAAAAATAAPAQGRGAAAGAGARRAGPGSRALAAVAAAVAYNAGSPRAQQQHQAGSTFAHPTAPKRQTSTASASAHDEFDALSFSSDEEFGSHAASKQPWVRGAVKGKPLERSSSSSNTAGRRRAAAGADIPLQDLQLLLAQPDLKWRAILPNGDRVGPFTAAELMAWLGGKGTAPKGVSREDAKLVLQQPSTLQLCGILTSDYNPQKLPGAKFFKPLPFLSAAAAAGQRYVPVTKALLNRGLPPHDWNSLPASNTSTAATTAAAAAPDQPAQQAPADQGWWVDDGQQQAGRAVAHAAQGAAAKDGAQQATADPWEAGSAAIAGPWGEQADDAGSGVNPWLVNNQGAAISSYAQALAGNRALQQAPAVTPAAVGVPEQQPNSDDHNAHRHQQQPQQQHEDATSAADAGHATWPQAVDAAEGAVDEGQQQQQYGAVMGVEEGIGAAGVMTGEADLQEPAPLLQAVDQLSVQQAAPWTPQQPQQPQQQPGMHQDEWRQQLALAAAVNPARAVQELLAAEQQHQQQQVQAQAQAQQQAHWAAQQQQQLLQAPPSWPQPALVSPPPAPLAEHTTLQPSPHLAAAVQHQHLLPQPLAYSAPVPAALPAQPWLQVQQPPLASPAGALAVPLQGPPDVLQVAAAEHQAQQLAWAAGALAHVPLPVTSLAPHWHHQPLMGVAPELQHVAVPAMPFAAQPHPGVEPMNEQQQQQGVPSGAMAVPTWPTSAVPAGFQPQQQGVAAAAPAAERAEGEDDLDELLELLGV